MASLFGCRSGERRRRGILAATAAALLIAASVADARAEAYRQLPNSRIAMEIGGAFTASSRFTGFLDEASGASFVIAEMPGHAYHEVKKLADRPAALASKGIVQTRKSELPGRSGEYVYVTGIQRTPRGDYAKFLLIMREDDVTAIITANVPVLALKNKTVARERIERALRSATVRPRIAKTAELFRLAYLGPFREAVSLMGTSKAYNLTGKIPEAGANRLGEPLFIVSPSLDKLQVPDIKAAAIKAFRTLGGFSELTVARESGVTISSLRGHAVTGEGKDIKSGRKMAIYLVMLAEKKGGYYLMVGMVLAGEANVYLPEFKKMAASFKPVG